MQMKSVPWLIVALVVAAGPGAGSASALSQHYYTRHDVLVGRTNGPTGWGTWVCERNPGGSSVWTRIAPTTLDEDWELLPATGVSGVTLAIVIQTGTQGLGGCNQTWQPLLYGNRYLDLVGTDGADQLYGGYGNTQLFGKANNDVIASYSIHNQGAALGGGEDDLVFDMSGGANTRLYGQWGNDCLHDLDGAAALFDCGGGNDRFVNNGTIGSTQQNCNVAVASCFW